MQFAGVRHRVALASHVFFSCFLLAGCNRASELDCEHIVDRIVELELRDQNITTPNVIEQRKRDVHANKRDELLEGCVGKRISKSALNCIDKAESARQIAGSCLQ